MDCARLNWFSRTDKLEYVLDDQTFGTLQALEYLRSQGFTGNEAIAYLRSLREDRDK